MTKTTSIEELTLILACLIDALVGVQHSPFSETPLGPG